MTPALFLHDVDAAFDHFIESQIRTAVDLYDLDGEIAFRRCGRTIETFDTTSTGGRP